METDFRNPARDCPRLPVHRSALSVRTRSGAFWRPHANREMNTVVSLVLVTGLRRSELFGLAWDCIDLDAGTIVRRTVIEVEREPVLREAGGPLGYPAQLPT
jgi:integrase